MLNQDLPWNIFHHVTILRKDVIALFTYFSYRSVYIFVLLPVFSCLLLFYDTLSYLRMLYRIARNGRTIIFSIHQPRYAIYKLFEHLVLLAKGNIVYQGPSADALDYFQDLGQFVNKTSVFINVTCNSCICAFPEWKGSMHIYKPVSLWQAIPVRPTTTRQTSFLTSSTQTRKQLALILALNVRTHNWYLNYKL